VSVRQPAAAVAAGKCLLARLFPRVKVRVEGLDHAGPCQWCDYPSDVLVGWLRDFHGWAGYDADADSYREPTVRDFRHMPRPRQRELVRAAQYPEAA
jgi:hypothetical protein